MTAFDELLAETIRTPGLLAPDVSLDEERKLFENDNPSPETPLLLGTATVSDRAMDMIIAFEISSEATYNKLYRHPVWPKGKSGVTIGIGYDIGYVTADVLARDWNDGIGAAAVAALTPCCGKTGDTANQMLAQVKSVDVPFAPADAVFKKTVIPRFVARTLAALPPGAENLSPDCLGALVSLAYNRGASFNADGDRYKEMRAIRDDIAQQQLADIPAQIRAMKRLWAGNPDMAGLLRRRDLEALLFEQGLA
ncbi:hypothetical protein SAMN05216345_11489 [Cupriavidus sp. YR651]|uniref:hypothetical protein n=1 Tax=Cupriavidus sp. YR651 TaxID=1855315 RepID=UPI00088CADCD|nr:hypothetical protein [Cupriavidus sp. YR651]SDD73022.1 hypothetical protein SAMN05216345_11489 [Cupriavidus sp. YR651]